MSHKRADVLIIGGGVVGLSTALFVARAGAEVIVVERDRIPCGAAYGNAGLLVPSHCAPLPGPGMLAQGLRAMLSAESALSVNLRAGLSGGGAMEMARWLLGFRRACTQARFDAAVEVYRELARESFSIHREFAAGDDADYEFDETGLYHLYLTSEAFREGQADAESLAAHGILSETISGEALRDADPAIGEKVVGAVVNRPDSRINPARFLQWLADRAEAAGARLLSETEVFGVSGGNGRGRRVLTTRGPMAADQIVIAAGAWTGAVARMMGSRVPIEGAKGYSLTFPRPETAPRAPLILEDYHVVITPFERTLRMTGFLELFGLDGSIPARRLAQIRKHVPAYLPGMRLADAVAVWRGFRPCAPDGLPVVGRLPGAETVWVAGGHATKGLTLGPGAGRRMSERLGGAPVSSIDRAVDPGRFG